MDWEAEFVYAKLVFRDRFAAEPAEFWKKRHMRTLGGIYCYVNTGFTMPDSVSDSGHAAIPDGRSARRTESAWLGRVHLFGWIQGEQAYGRLHRGVSFPCGASTKGNPRTQQ
jgi:hypothetical protein